MTFLGHITSLGIARTPFVFVVALLLAIGTGESIVHAGCGDYVFLRNASGQLIKASTLQPGETSKPCNGLDCRNEEAIEKKSEHDAPIRLPCTGPACSQNSQLPAPLPSPVPLQSSQEFAALGLNYAGDGSCPNSLFEGASSSNGCKLHFSQSIFHPPR